jgi:predicted CoA-binding protein
MAATRPSVAIIGASNDRSKFGNKAVRAFRDVGWDVFPINPSLTEVEGIPAYPDLAAVPRDRLDRVSLYVPPAVGLRVLDDVARKPVGEVWLNPGTESPEVLARAEDLGLNVIQECSILAIGRSPGHY